MDKLLDKIKPHYRGNQPILAQLQNLTSEGVLTEAEYWWLYSQITNEGKRKSIIATLSS